MKNGKMRVIVFGTRITLHRLSQSLGKEGIELVSPSETHEAIALLKHESFDLVVVDTSVKEADEICRRIEELECIPVALLVDKKRADWRRLDSLHSNGYICRNTKGAELAARLRAVARRGQLNGVSAENGSSHLGQGQNVTEQKAKTLIIKGASQSFDKIAGMQHKSHTGRDD